MPIAIRVVLTNVIIGVLEHLHTYIPIIILGTFWLSWVVLPVILQTFNICTYKRLSTGTSIHLCVGGWSTKYVDWLVCWSVLNDSALLPNAIGRETILKELKRGKNNKYIVVKPTINYLSYREFICMRLFC